MCRVGIAHRWLRWYEAQGLPRARRSLPSSYQVLAPDGPRGRGLGASRHVVATRTGDLAGSCTTCRAGIDPAPSRSGTYRALERHGLIDPEARRRRDRRFKRWERGGAMELWQMDVVGGVLLADGREAKILTGVDDNYKFVCAGLMPGNEQGRVLALRPGDRASRCFRRRS